MWVFRLGSQFPSSSLAPKQDSETVPEKGTSRDGITDSLACHDSSMASVVARVAKHSSAQAAAANVLALCSTRSRNTRRGKLASARRQSWQTPPVGVTVRE